MTIFQDFVDKIFGFRILRGIRTTKLGKTPCFEDLAHRHEKIFDQQGASFAASQAPIRQAVGEAPEILWIHLVMWAWSAKPVSAAMLHKRSEPRVMRSHASRALNSARKTDGVTP